MAELTFMGRKVPQKYNHTANDLRTECRQLAWKQLKTERKTTAFATTRGILNLSTRPEEKTKKTVQVS